MARSIKKGFFVDYHLLEKIEKAVKGGARKPIQDMVAALHNHARLHRPHVQRPHQRQAVHRRLRDREHGRPQAWSRVFGANARLQGTRRRNDPQGNLRKPAPWEVFALTRNAYACHLRRCARVAPHHPGPHGHGCRRIPHAHPAQVRTPDQQDAQERDRERGEQQQPRGRHLLTVKSAVVVENGPVLKRFKAGAKGTAMPRRKEDRQHIRIVLFGRKPKPSLIHAAKKQIRSASRLAVRRDWQSRWFRQQEGIPEAPPRGPADTQRPDGEAEAGLGAMRIFIERAAASNRVRVKIYTARPGIVHRTQGPVARSRTSRPSSSS